MLAVISPAKRLDWTVESPLPTTLPVFQDDAKRLATTAKRLPLRDLKALMHLSDDLARLNRDRFASFQPEPNPSTDRPAAFAFAGDTYMGLDAGTMSDDALHYAQDHLRILSGLYGVLRPLDVIQPYRLEMGSRLKTRRGATLYAYWGDQLAKALNAQAAEMGTDILVNCASNEYFGAVDLKALKLKVVTPVFLEEKNGTAKTVSFFAKKARGAMARFIMEQEATRIEDLQAFDFDGYRFDTSASDESKPVFRRAYPASAAMRAAE